jgi:hypothetical protein
MMTPAIISWLMFATTVIRVVVGWIIESTAAGPGHCWSGRASSPTCALESKDILEGKAAGLAV